MAGITKIVQSVLENIDGGRLHDVRKETIPVVDYSLGEEVFKRSICVAVCISGVGVLLNCGRLL